jgi:tRNA dimethylallyltransferase
MKPKLVVITGPTAVGKSDLARELAREIDAEIINADSQQVYREMDIGTAKPSPEEREKIRHHLVDLVYPNEEFNVAMFRQAAASAASDIWSRGKQAIVCGGTGFYIKALTRGLFVGPPHSPEVRAGIRAQIEEKGRGYVHERLQRVDPAAATWIHPNDRHRLTRALEVYELTGKPISQWQKEHGFSEHAFETLMVALDRERGDLYHRINDRCERMIHEGLVEEVRGLIEKGYGLDLKALQSIGYRHAGLYLTGAIPLKDAVDLMKRDTRRLAKRQLTWFRGDQEIHWFHPNLSREDINAAVKEFLKVA